MVVSWQYSITNAIRDSHLEVIGHDSIQNEAQALVGEALLRAYPEAPGFLYFEATSPDDADQPGDVLICHPKLGFVVLEVKAYSIDFIRRIQGNQLIVAFDGFEKPVDPRKQAKQVMFSIINRLKREFSTYKVSLDDLPLSMALVAFPNIQASEWRDKGYDESLPESAILFREHFLDLARLQQRLTKIVENGLRKSGLGQPLNVGHYDLIKWAIGDSDAIHSARPPRIGLNQKKLGSFVDTLLRIERHLSDEQKKIADLRVEGYPRLIRGVAGSGKTIVLTKMVARYLAYGLNRQLDMFETNPPPARVAVLCFNRTLVPLIRDRIATEYRILTHHSLPEDRINVCHMNGLMMMLADEGELSYIPVFGEMQNTAARAAAYLTQLSHRTLLQPFTAIFVDEGQDLDPVEYQLLLRLLRPTPKTGERNLVIFYDDAQNLYAKTRPNWKSLGIDVGRGNRSQVMKECYRNSQEVVELGLNVLLGMQAPEDMRVTTRSYTDINYMLRLGLAEDLGDHIRVSFTKRKFRKPIIRAFAERQQEMDFVVSEVVRLIVDEMVRPEDILVLFPSHREYRDLADHLQHRIPAGYMDGFVRPYLQNEKNEFIFRSQHLTLSTIHAAKGYDASVVFLMGVDQCDLTAEGRAAFYVGATRSKLALYVTGVDLVGEHTLLHEAERVNAML